MLEDSRVVRLFILGTVIFIVVVLMIIKLILKYRVKRFTDKHEHYGMLVMNRFAVDHNITFTIESIEDEKLVYDFKIIEQTFYLRPGDHLLKIRLSEQGVPTVVSSYRALKKPNFSFLRIHVETGKQYRLTYEGLEEGCRISPLHEKL